MTTIQFRRALLAMAVTGAFLALAAPAAFAMPHTPAADPKCGSAAGLMNFAITTTPPNPPGSTTGKNFVSIQRVSPINGSPDNLSNNGFTKICARLDRPGGLAFDVNSDGIADTATVTQFDPVTGGVNGHVCDNTTPNASQAWDEGQGVEIKVALGGGLGATDISLIVPGVECSQKFAAYKNASTTSAKGQIFFPTPNSTICTSPQCICDQLNLPAGSFVRTVLTSANAAKCFPAPAPCGNIDTHPCGALPSVTLRVGEAALIFGGNAPGGGTTTEGRPVNCTSPVANPLPCPAPPSEEYPSPLIY